MIGSFELCTRAGITTRQLHHWLAKGYISAVREDPAGTGYPLEFTPDDVEVARIMGLLTSAGVLPAAAATAARSLATEGTAQLGAFTLTQAAS